jgi:hypothetical protein
LFALACAGLLLGQSSDQPRRSNQPSVKSKAGKQRKTGVTASKRTLSQPEKESERDNDPPPVFDPSPLAPVIPPDQFLPRDPGAVLVLPNVKVNPDVGIAAQNETTIAVNPVSNDLYASGANDYNSTDGRAHCGAYFSTNSAQSWSGFLLPQQPTYTDAGDPAVAFDQQGNLYYSCLQFTRLANGSPNTSAMYVFKSTNSGMTYGAPTLVTTGVGPGDVHDKEYIATDHFNGKVYMSWTHFTATADILFAGSNNGGATFASPAPTVISDPTNNNNQGSVPAAGAVANQVYVAWEDFNISRILIDKSNNGGITFNALGGDITVVNITPLPGTLPGEFGNFRVNSFPTMDVCRNESSPFNGHVYVAWADNRNGDGDILFVKSVNGGATWSAPLRVNDDALGNGRDQFFPWLSVDENCKINIAFYDRRDDPANRRFHIYFTHSTDDGVTFVPNARVTTAPSTNAQFMGTFIGDYIGLTSTTASSSAFHHQVRRAVPMWTDTRNGNQDVFAATLLQITNAANLDLVNGASVAADDLEIIIPGNQSGKVNVFCGVASTPCGGPFRNVSTVFNAGANQTTVTLSNPAVPIAPGATVHIGFTINNNPNPMLVQLVWTSGGVPINAPPSGSFDLKWNPNTGQFSAAICNDRSDSTPVTVANLQFAVVDLPLMEEDLIQDPVDRLTPALAQQGKVLLPLGFPTGPIVKGQCSTVPIPVTLQAFQAVVLKLILNLVPAGTAPAAGQSIFYAQGLAKSSEICDVNRDGEVDLNDINSIFLLRDTVAPLGFPSDSAGMVTVNVARQCVLRCTNPNCAH